MSITTRSLAAILIGLSLWGCQARHPQATWIDPSDAPSPAHLSGGDCLNLRNLPRGWKIASYSTTAWAIRVSLDQRHVQLFITVQ
jgi:hypothetical protein